MSVSPLGVQTDAPDSRPVEPVQRRRRVAVEDRTRHARHAEDVSRGPLVDEDGPVLRHDVHTDALHSPAWGRREGRVTVVTRSS